MANTHKNIVLFDRMVAKAVDNGWDMFGNMPFKLKGGAEWGVIDKNDFNHTPLLVITGKGQSAGFRAYYEFEQVVFNRSFVKKLWDDAWDYHITNLARSPYRWDYLHDNWQNSSPPPKRLKVPSTD